MLGAALGLLALVAGVAMLAGALRPARGSGLPPAWMRRAGNPLAAALAAAAATVAVQSSSLVIIGLLAAADAEALPLAGAWGGVLGANVGSALLPHLLLWQPPLTVIAVLAFPAAALWMQARTRRFGRGLAGALSVYAGLELVATAARGLVPPTAFTALAGGGGAYALGAAATALLFSSTLTIGVAQRLAQAGLVPLASALAFTLGANVGTTADVLVAAVPCGIRGRRTALFHLTVNLLGSAVALPLVPAAAAWLQRTQVPPVAAVAHFHAAFNLIAALLALPLVTPLA